MEKIKVDKAVSLNYTMRSFFPDGTFKDHGQEHVEFIFGVDSQVPSLERALEGCRIGEKGRAEIPSSELYGDHDPSLVKEIPKKGLIKQRLKEGQFYRQMKLGHLVSFKVLELKPHTVIADFNGPMTGIRVTIDFEVQGIRDASGDEINAAMEKQMKKSIGCA